MRNLALELRPRSLDDMVGMENLASQIREQISTDRIPTTWLFTGANGTGKTTLARIIAVSLQCEEQKKFGCPCKKCWELLDNKTFSIQEEDLGSNTSVDFARDLTQHSVLMPRFGKYRVYILDEAHMQTTQAQNSMLKHFEDCPETTIWMICTTKPQKIISGIIGRCASASYIMPVPGIKEISSIVSNTLLAIGSKEKILSSKALVSAIQEAGIVSPRVIVGATERWLAGGSLDECVFVGSPCSVNVLAICRAVEKGDWFTVAKLLSSGAEDDGRIVRSAVAGWFRKLLLRKEVDVGMREHAAESIHILSDHSSFEDGLQLSSTTASLYQICKLYKTRKTQEELFKAKLGHV